MNCGKAISTTASACIAPLLVSYGDARAITDAIRDSADRRDPQFSLDGEEKIVRGGLVVEWDTLPALVGRR